MAEVTELKDANFYSFLAGSPIPVAVAFYTHGAKPAIEELSTVRELAKEYEGVVRFAAVNADEGLRTVDYLGILCVPTIILFQKQKIVDRIVGLISREALGKRLEEDLRRLL